MAATGSWLSWGANPLDEQVEKATTELTPASEENIALYLEICDQIRSKQVTAKQAMQSLKRRLDHKNPNVQLKTLSLLDVCIKNGGSHFLIEITSREFVDNLVSLLKSSAGGNYQVKDKILACVQAWSIAFKGKSELSYLESSYKMLQNEGYHFPRLETATSAIMVDTATAPDWVDSIVCMRCRTPFSLTNRKHHCRNCGQVFDQQCSSKTMALPHYGVNEEVRVCDGCHMKLLLKKQKGTNSISHRSPASTTHMQTNVPGRRRDDDDDDADFRRALELSLQDSKNNGFVPPAPTPVAAAPVNEAEEDPELAAAIAASLRDMRAPVPSAPMSSLPATPATEQAPILRVPTTVNPHMLTSIEEENIVLFSKLVDRINSSGGEILQDGQLQELYEQIGALKPKLYRTLDGNVQKHKSLVEMHEKVTRCVRTYDRLLEQRLASASMRRQQAPPLRTYSQGPPPQPPQQRYSNVYPNVSSPVQGSAPQLYGARPMQSPMPQQVTGQGQPQPYAINGPQSPAYAPPQQQQQYQRPPPQQYAGPPPQSPYATQFGYDQKQASYASPPPQQPQHAPQYVAQQYAPQQYAPPAPVQQESSAPLIDL